MLTVITTTHDRPEVFHFLEKWMAHQTTKPDQWLVVNDSDPDFLPAYTYTMGQDVVVRKPVEGERHSLCENWLTALCHVRHNNVIVMEDDDYYAPNYLSTMQELLQTSPLVGLSNDCYWNVRTQEFRNLGNVDHASLATTGFWWVVNNFLYEVAERGDPYIDFGLWRGWDKEKVLASNLVGKTALHVGIKGLVSVGSPGAGISTPSHYHSHGFHRDWHCAKLRDWIGQDAYDYIRICRRLEEEAIMR